jgi:hypothetical protein
VRSFTGQYRERWKFESQELCNTHTLHCTYTCAPDGGHKFISEEGREPVVRVAEWIGFDIGFCVVACLSLGQLVSCLLYTFIKSAYCQNVWC